MLCPTQGEFLISWNFDAFGSDRTGETDLPGSVIASLDSPLNSYWIDGVNALTDCKIKSKIKQNMWITESIWLEIAIVCIMCVLGNILMGHGIYIAEQIENKK